MKQLLFFFAAAMLLTSCWKLDQPTPPRLLPEGVFMEERVPEYDSVKRWNVEKKQFIMEWGIARYKVVPIREYEVVPTGKQVMKYASKSGYNTLAAFGIIIILSVIIGGAFLSCYDVHGRGMFVIRSAAMVIAVGVGLLTLMPANIARNNAKTITEKQLIYYQQQDPELGTFWDSVYYKDALLK